MFNMFDDLLFQQYLGYASNVFLDHGQDEKEVNELFEAFSGWYYEHSWLSEYLVREAYERLGARVAHMRENTNTDLVDLAHIVAADILVQHFISLYLYGRGNLDNQIEVSCDAYVY